MIITFTTKEFPGVFNAIYFNFKGEFIPTLFDQYSQTMIVDGKSINLGLWDYAGFFPSYPFYFTGRSAESDSMDARFSYPGTDVFILVFSVISPTSFADIKKHWLPFITTYKPNTPIILLGTKVDLREDNEIISKMKEKGFFLDSSVQFRNGANS